MKQLTTSNQVKYTILDALHDMSFLISEGHINALEGKILLDDLKKSIEKVESEISESVMNEAIKFHGTYYGDYLVEVRKGGGRYQYDHIPEIVDIQVKLKELQKLAQQSYQMKIKNVEMISQDAELILPANYLCNKDSVVLKRKGST